MRAREILLRGSPRNRAPKLPGIQDANDDLENPHRRLKHCGRAVRLSE